MPHPLLAFFMVLQNSYRRKLLYTRKSMRKFLFSPKSHFLSFPKDRKNSPENVRFFYRFRQVLNFRLTNIKSRIVQNMQKYQEIFTRPPIWWDSKSFPLTPLFSGYALCKPTPLARVWWVLVCICPEFAKLAYMPEG